MARPNELETPRQVSIVIEEQEYNELLKISKERNISMSAVIRSLLKYKDYAEVIASHEARIKELERKLSQYESNVVKYENGMDIYYHRKLNAICLAGTTKRVDIDTLPQELKDAWHKFQRGEISEQELRDMLKQRFGI